MCQFAAIGNKPLTLRCIPPGTESFGSIFVLVWDGKECVCHGVILHQLLTTQTKPITAIVSSELLTLNCHQYAGISSRHHIASAIYSEMNERGHALSADGPTSTRIGAQPSALFHYINLSSSRSGGHGSVCARFSEATNNQGPQQSVRYVLANHTNHPQKKTEAKITPSNTPKRGVISRTGFCSSLSVIKIFSKITTIFRAERNHPFNQND